MADKKQDDKKQDDKKQDDKKLEKIELDKKKILARIAPYDKKINTLDQSTAKERAINPMAIRPLDVHVTITEEKEEVSLIKNLFGF
jgi:hypothetical protein